MFLINKEAMTNCFTPGQKQPVIITLLAGLLYPFQQILRIDDSP